MPCAQSCPILWGPLDCNLLGSSVNGIFQARILEVVAISFSKGSSPPRGWTRVLCVSCPAGGFLTHWAIRETLPHLSAKLLITEKLNKRLASLVVQSANNLSAMQETWVRPLGWEDPLEKEMATTSVFLPGKSHGQRSLAGYIPKSKGSQESDMT